MNALPWWAKMLLPVVVRLLVTLIKPFLDEHVGVEMEKTIVDFIMHILGATDQLHQVTKVQDAHKCLGIACSAEVKGLQ